MIICNARSFQVSGKEFVPQEDRDALHSYVTQFLTDKHPHRTGNVCPFVPLALKHDAIQFVLPEVSEQASPRTLIRTTLDKFLLWRKMHAHIRGAMIIVFPRNFSVDALRKAQQRELIAEVQGEHHAALQQTRQLARFLCGLPSPSTARSSLRQHKAFGALENLGFQQLLALAKQI